MTRHDNPLPFPDSDSETEHHAASPTAYLLDELALYGYRPGQDEPDPRPMPETDLATLSGGVTIRRLGGLHIDLGRHEVMVDGDRVHLTLSEFKVLSLLAEQPERVISRRELMQHLWASEHVGDEHACEVHISNLRRKIEKDPSQPERLVTVRGMGYKLVAI